MFTVAFWKGALERAIKSAAGALLTLWTTDVVFDALNVNWKQALGVALGSAVVSVLMSVVSVGVGPAGSPSLVPDRPADPENRS
jgi:hypothetical protein